MFLVRLRALSNAYQDGFTECMNATVGFLADSGSHASPYEAETMKNCLLQESRRRANPVPSHRGGGGGGGGGTGVNSSRATVVAAPRPIIPAFVTLSCVEAASSSINTPTVGNYLGVPLASPMLRHGATSGSEFFASSKSRFLPYARTPLRERNQNICLEEGQRLSSSRTAAASSTVRGNGQSTVGGNEAFFRALSPENPDDAEKRRTATTPIDRNCSTKDENLWRPF